MSDTSRCQCYFCKPNQNNDLDMIPIKINGKPCLCCKKCVKKLNKIYEESEESEI